eukprot:927084_1
MDKSDTCVASTVVSKYVIIAYGSLYGLLLIAVSIYSFNSLNEDEEFKKKSCFKRFKAWILDLKKRKSCYIPIIAHLFDQITDIAVTIQFYELSQTKSANKWAACNGLNMQYLFILTVLSLIVYRVVTGYLIFIYTNHSCTRFCSQILDIELFRALFVNYICKKTEPCDPQRWITAMEAVLESTPQALIQMIYLVKTDAFDISNMLIIISLASSLWSIISKVIADDKVTVVLYSRKLNLDYKTYGVCQILYEFIKVTLTFILNSVAYIVCCPYWFYSVQLFGPPHVPGKQSDAPLALELFGREGQGIDIKSFSWSYIYRVLWRVCDVSSRIFMMTLIWLIMGGFSLSIIVGFEFSVFLVICIRTKHWEFIFGVVSLVASCDPKTVTISRAIFVYRTITNHILMVSVTVYLFMEFECDKCTEYEYREELSRSSSSIYAIFMYCWCAVILSPRIFVIMSRYQMFLWGATSSRDVDQMMRAENYDGIHEIQLYRGGYTSDKYSSVPFEVKWMKTQGALTEETKKRIRQHLKGTGRLGPAIAEVLAVKSSDIAVGEGLVKDWCTFPVVQLINMEMDDVEEVRAAMEVRAGMEDAWNNHVDMLDAAYYTHQLWLSYMDEMNRMFRRHFGLSDIDATACYVHRSAKFLIRTHTPHFYGQ